MSILISGAERRAIVLQNGKLIGWARLSIEGGIDRPQLLTLLDTSPTGRQWARVALPGQSAAAATGTARIAAPAEFRAKVEQILQPGATVILTPDALRPGTARDLLESRRNLTRRN